MRVFDEWIGQFRQSIATFDYYIDFHKVVEQAKRHKPELCLMNALIGTEDVQSEFRSLVQTYPSVLRCVPILLAARSSELFGRDATNTSGKWYDFSSASGTMDDYCEFMEKTGLFNMISRHLVSNMYDYVLGVETGLDSNGRKNRGGHLMEDLVEGFLVRAGVRYRKEMYASEVEREYGLDLSQITNGGKAKKRFDFVVKGISTVYGIEANFYQSDKQFRGGGSKLNETARSYKMIALESRGVKGFRFVWFTDGGAWHNARNNLREVFDVLPDLYNIKELEDGIAEKVFT